MSLESTQQFFEIAVQQGMLAHETVHELQLEASSRQMEGSMLVLQKGLMTPLDVEIVETLRLPAESVPGYEIQSVLGRGGMGVVYRARQVALDRPVALKMILISHTANPTMLARFELEAQTVGRLLHPHIITAYDFGRHNGRLFFAMEYVEGEDAERYLKRLHPLTERQAWLLVRQVAAGLAHAAESGIVHRDVKPANLLLVSPPRGYPLPLGTPMVKIADFGLAFLSAEEASQRTRLTSEQSTLGSPHYMAPEQLNAGHPVDERADIYSLGATAYHLIAGQPPFDGRTLPQIIAQKLHGSSPSLAILRPGISTETDQLIQQMLARDPKDRIDNYATLMDRIDALPVMAVEGTVTISPSNPTVKIEVNKPALSLSWKQVVVAAVISVIIGFGALSLFSKRENSLPKPQAMAPSSLKETGFAAELFDGKSLQGWVTKSGTWNVDTDDEGGSIIVGSGGEVMRSLSKPAGNRAERLQYYRLTIAASLHAASAVELHFNVNKTGARDVVRLTPDRIALGHRADFRAAFAPTSDAKPFEIGVERMHEIRVERDVNFWRVSVDDIEIGTVAAPQSTDLPEFRLVADGGPAWFSDMFVEELSPK